LKRIKRGGDKVGDYPKVAGVVGAGLMATAPLTGAPMALGGVVAGAGAVVAGLDKIRETPDLKRPLLSENDRNQAPWDKGVYGAPREAGSTPCDLLGKGECKRARRGRVGPRRCDWSSKQRVCSPKI